MTAGRLLQMSGVMIDLLYRVEAVPAPGDEARVTGFATAAGGGFNAMVAARRAGMHVTYGGAIGAGPFADMVAAALAAEAITAPRPRLAGRDQGCCAVLIDPSGERTFIAAAGADGVATEAELGLLPADDFDWLLLSGYGLSYRDSRAALTGWLEALPAGAPLVFDPSPMIATIPARSRDAAARRARWISANAAEAAVLTGRADPAEAAAALAADRPEAGGAVVRDGANGCFLAQPGDAARHVPGFAVAPVDTTGAGDTHVGAFIAALSRGWPPRVAAEYANVAAALSTTREGPATAPRHDEVVARLGRSAQLAAAL